MSKTLKLFENLTLDEIYHPKFYNFIYDILTVIIGLNTGLLPLMCYIIIKHSTKQMGNYKHLLIIQVMYSYIFGIITFLWKPVLIWPLRQAFFLGWIDIGPRNFHITFVLEIFFIFGIIVAQFYVILFRIIATIKSAFWHSLYGNTRIFYAAVLTSMLLVEIIVIVPICADEPDMFQVQTLTSKEVPAVADLIKIYPNLGGYHPEYEKGGIEFMLGFGFCICTATPFLFMATIIFFLIRLRNIVEMVSSTTYKMEVMLFRALLSQLIILTIFVLTPVALFILLMILGVSWGSYFATPCVIFVTFHMFVDSISLIFIIKPYRNFVFQKLGFLRNRVTSSNQPSRQQIRSIT